MRNPTRERVMVGVNIEERCHPGERAWRQKDSKGKKKKKKERKKKRQAHAEDACEGKRSNNGFLIERCRTKTFSLDVSRKWNYTTPFI